MQNKKKLILSIFLSTSFLFTSCNNSNSSDKNTDIEENESNKNKNDEEIINKDFRNFDLSGYTANIGNVSAIGVKNKESAKRNLSTSVQKNEIIMQSFGTDSNKPLKMQFSKVVKLEGDKVVNDFLPYVAKSKTSVEYEIVSSSLENFVIKPKSNAKFCLYDKNSKKEISKWVKGSTENITLTIEDSQNLESLDSIEVKTISCDAQITFVLTDGFKYSLFDNKKSTKPLDGFDNILDNSNNDLNEVDGIVTLSGLEENKEYYLNYVGQGNVINISQEEMNAEVDKLYVENNFTFISFVPEGQSNRPDHNDKSVSGFDPNTLEYDRLNYTSDESYRKSYIIDNDSGLIYPIVNFNINEIRHGLLEVSNNHQTLSSDELLSHETLCDFKINKNNELEIFPVFTNKSIQAIYNFKDKYGHKYVLNKQFDEFDKANDTTFYQIPGGNVKKYYYYFLTSKNETLKVYLDGGILSAKLIDENYNEIDVPSNTKFEVYGRDTTSYIQPYYYENDKLYFKTTVNDIFIDSTHNPFGYLNLKTNERVSMNDWGYNRITIDTAFGLTNNIFLKDGYLLEYDRDDKNLYYYKNIFGMLEKYYENNTTRKYYDHIYEVPGLTRTLLIENCEVNFHQSKIKKTGINGDTFYEVVVVDNNGKKELKVFEENTYFKPVTIILQPINGK